MATPNPEKIEQPKKISVNKETKEKIKNAPKDQSFDQYLASLGEQTIKDIKKEVSSSYKNINTKINSALSAADKSIKGVQEWAKTSAEKLDKQYTQISNDIKEGVKNGTITSINFLKNTGELVINGVKHQVRYEIGRTIYTIKVAKEGIVYLGDQGKKIAGNTIKAGQRAYADAVVRGKETGKDIANIPSVIQKGIDNGYIKTVAFIKEKGTVAINGIEYAGKVALGAGIYTLNAGSNGINYLSKKGKEVAINTLKAADQAGKDIKERGKQTGKDAVALSKTISQGIDNGWIKTVSFAKESGIATINGIKYLAKVSVGLGVYTIAAGKEGVVYLSNKGKEVAINTLKAADQAGKDIKERGKETGKDIANIPSVIQKGIDNGYIKTVAFIKEKGTVAINGIEYAGKVMVGLGVYTLNAGSNGINYVSNKGKEVAINTLKAADQAGKDIKERGKQTGKDVTALSKTISQGVENGWIKTVSFAKESGIATINGIKYLAKVSVGLGVYTLNAGSNGINYVSNKGKEIAINTIKAANQAGKDVKERGKQTGKDVVAMQESIAQGLENGYYKSIKFVKETGTFIIDEAKSYTAESYQTFLKESGASNPDTWNTQIAQ